MGQLEPQLGAAGIGCRRPFPASLRKICEKGVSTRERAAIPTAHLSIGLGCLTSADSPPAVDDGKWYASDALPARLIRHVLDFFLKLLRLKELESLRRHVWEISHTIPNTEDLRT